MEMGMYELEIENETHETLCNIMKETRTSEPLAQES